MNKYMKKKKKCRLILVYNTKENCLLVVFNEVKMEEDLNEDHLKKVCKEKVHKQ